MLDITKIKTYPVKRRHSKVKLAEFARPPRKGLRFKEFYLGLPGILKARDLAAVVGAIVKARRGGRRRSVVFMAGAHVIKCGLNPVLIELIKRKVITCICLNGAGIIHDFEIALQAKTSEDVAKSLGNGSFGMCRETADFINTAAVESSAAGLGLGEAVARKIGDARLVYRDKSLLYNALRYGVPVYVFVAIGTDIVHQHPSFDAAATAKASLRDFRSFSEHLRGINKGGVVLNFGSAVVLPEVFLKALNLARNLGYPVKDFTTANFDMFMHYRPQQNVVSRPVMTGGKGYYIVGHHEIMLPLLAQAVIERL